MRVRVQLRRGVLRQLAAAALAAVPSAAFAADNNWNGNVDSNWSSAGNWSLGAEPGTGDAAFFPLGEPTAITLSSGETASSLSFLNSYALTGGSLALTTGNVRVNLAETVTLGSELTGSANLNKSGGGALVLSNASNSFTGTVNISNGTVVVKNLSALGTSTNPITTTGSGSRGFGGGTLLLDGSSGSLNLSRTLSLQGRGTVVDRGSALIAVGNNTLSGTVNMAVGNVNTRITSTNGVLNLTGTLNVAGTFASQFSILGGINQGGVNNFNLSGTLTGTGTLEKMGGGMLLLNPSSVSGFGGTFRISPNSTGTQSSVRITANNVLGTRTATGTGAVLDLNGGILEVRMNTPQVQSGGTLADANVFTRVGSTIFADRGIGGSAINQTLTFGTHLFEDNQTSSVSSRNGYNVTYGQTTVNGGDNGSTFTNNLQGGLLTFGGSSFWNNADNGASRTLTINGNGDTLITGNVIASAASFNHNLIKSGTRTLTIAGTGSTLSGSVSVQDGTLAVTDFRSITNNSQLVNIGNGGTSASFAVVGNNVAAADLTTAKVFDLIGTTGGATLLANQTGTSPGVTLTSGITATGAGTKTLTLAGTNTGDNLIAGTIVNNSSANITQLVKTGSGTWVLGGNNTNTGALAISNGTLKLKAGSGASTVWQDSTAIGFNVNATTLSAGGRLDFVGAPGVASNETVGTLGLVAGANTVAVNAGAGGTASLTFSGLSAAQTLTAASSASTTVTVASTAGLVPGMLIIGGTSNATIASISSGTTFVASTAQTLSSGAALTFVRPTGVVTNSGSTVNFVPDANSSVVIASVPAAGLLNAHSYFNGANFAYAPATTNATLTAPVYDGSLAGFSTVAGGATLTTGNNNLIDSASGSSGLVTQAAAVTVPTIKLSAATTLTANALVTLQTAANSPGGILLSGGGATINGTTGITTGGTGDLVIRTDLSTDTLTLGAPITSTTTGGLTKSGAGTLVISATNNQTGATNLNEGTIRLSGTGRLSAANVNLNIRQGATLDLNGVGSGTAIAALQGAGLVTNSASSTPAVLTVGNNNGGGIYSGVIEDGVGGISVVKQGTGSPTWSGLNTYTGSTTINSTGTISMPFMANIGSPSGIGAGNASANAASLIIASASSTQGFGGISYTGAMAVSTNRLFTFGSSAASSGARIQASGVNNVPIVWSNTGALAFSTTNIAQGLLLAGASTGDNRFFPQITDNGTGVVSVYKTDSGVWHLSGASNSYTGVTELRGGVLYAQDGTGLPNASNLVLNGGVYAGTGTMNRTLGTGGSNLRFATPAAGTAGFRGGFAAGDTKLVVDWGSVPTWGSTANFVSAADGLILGSSVALDEVEIAGSFSLGTASGAAGTPTVTTSNGNNSITTTSTTGLIVGQTISGANIPSGSYITAITAGTTFTISNNSTGSGSVTATIDGNSERAIRVDDNGNTANDYATISGVISGDAGTGLRKLGGGILRLGNANTYSGVTNVNQGTLVITSLGKVGGGSSSSVGAPSSGDAGAVTLGNGGTGAATLIYTGAGEVSDRKIRLYTTTGSNQIHASGTGPLILSNVSNDMVGGAKRLILRGESTFGNMVTSQLSDNGGSLAVEIGGGAVWTLNNATNNYSGGTFLNEGALGVGDNAALGSGTITINNSTMFAQGGDRTIANSLTTGSGSFPAFIGDHSLTFTSPYVHGVTTADSSITNTIATGKQLSFAGLTANGLTAARTLTFSGTGDTVFAGAITTSTAFPLNLTLNGTGATTLASTSLGSDLKTGRVQVTGTGGRFIVDGTMTAGTTAAPNQVTAANASIIVNGTLTGPVLANNATATIGGSGSIAGPLTITNGTLSPGNSAGTLTVGSGSAAATDTNLTFASGSKFLAELVSDASADRVNVNGNTTGTGALLQISLGSGYIPENDTFLLIDNGGTTATPKLFNTVQLVAGGTGAQAAATFVQVGSTSVWNATDAAGNFFSINYAGLGTAGSNDVVLTVTAVPEPAAVGLLAMAGLGLLSRRRRH